MIGGLAKTIKTTRGSVRLGIVVCAGLVLPMANSVFAGPSSGTAVAEVLSFEKQPPLVGMEGRLEVLLPEAGLSALPPERLLPVHLRIAASKPQGKLFYYDLRYTGRVVGDHDLRDCLETIRHLPATNLPALPVSIAGLLPDPHNGWLVDQKARQPFLFGGYRNLAILAGAFWLLALLVVARFGKKAKPVAVAPPPRPPSFAERLRPLLERAAAGLLSADEKATLERMLIAHWQQRLGLTKKSGDEIIPVLRQHAEAGVLLRTLEDWLHRPPGSVKVSVDAVLAPYRNLPDEPLVEVAR